jgi:hypothetical protein
MLSSIIAAVIFLSTLSVTGPVSAPAGTTVCLDVTCVTGILCSRAYIGNKDLPITTVQTGNQATLTIKIPNGCTGILEVDVSDGAGSASTAVLIT